MGGCKCTYRSCSMKSDGQTHMFHYPVFDKFRCHQWLTNAKRLEFLNLKLSQLKNRVVCQHHFKPDSFMNYKMAKLRFDAVPVLNGPHCDANEDSDEEDINPSKAFDLNTMIGPEDIEDDPHQLNFKDKKANFSVKYADFLISSETHCFPTSLIELTKSEKSDPSFTVYQHNKTYRNSECPSPPTQAVTPYSESNNKRRTRAECNFEVPIVPTETNAVLPTRIKVDKSSNVNETPVPGTKKQGIKILSEKKILTPFAFKGKLETVSPSLVIRPRDRKKEQQMKMIPMNDLENMDIIIHNPQNIDTNVNDQQVPLNPITIESHNMQIKQDAPYNVSVVNQGGEANIMASTNQVTDGQDPYQCQTVPPTTTESSETTLQEQSINKQSNQIKNQTSPKVSVLKSMIPPERVAAIEEKRKFNKKLRDMIEFCLDELDDPEKQAKENNKSVKNINISEREINPGKRIQSLSPNKIEMKPKNRMKPNRLDDGSIQKDNKLTSVKSDNNENSSQKVISFLSKEPELPSVAEYGMSAIEARLKKMEETLLQKIEQNSNRIMDLKTSLATTAVEKKSILTQTKEDEESHKKQLFKEISQYLSPNVNSLIYEEMFLYKFTKNEDIPMEDYSKQPKRRKRR